MLLQSELKAEQEWESGLGTSTFTGRLVKERNPIRLKRGDGTGGSHPLTYLWRPPESVCTARIQFIPSPAPWVGQS